MKNLNKLTAIALSALFATMQVSNAAIDTGLGNGLGGAVIKDSGSFTPGKGLVGVETGDNYATLNFNDTTMVHWDTLNVGRGETLNFNTVDGANNISVINKVLNGMSYFKGNINADSGIGQLIISNPNGVLFDGAKFTTAGDAIITAQKVYMNNNREIVYGNEYNAVDPANRPFHMEIVNSDFNVGGELHFMSPTLLAANRANHRFSAGKGVKFTTSNGQDYFVDYALECKDCTNGENYKEISSMRLDAIQVDGDVYVVNNDKGIVKFVNGGEINGNLDVKSNGSASLNYVFKGLGATETAQTTATGKVLHVAGDANVKANGVMAYARDTKVDGNLNITNGGGFVEVYDVNVGKDMNLTTIAESENPCGYKHFIHVNGNTTVGGFADLNSDGIVDVADIALSMDLQKDIEQHMTNNTYSEKADLNSDGVIDVADITTLIDIKHDIEQHLINGTPLGNATINSVNNIHIGNYDIKQGELLPGKFTVAGTLTAHADDGHVMTTIDVNANKVDFASNKLNILGSEDAVITANEYSFKSNGYIGALKATPDKTVAEHVIDVMENYKFIPNDTDNHGYITIAGGKIEPYGTITGPGHITNIETPKDANTYIRSDKDILLTGANAGNINLTTNRSTIEITGDNVHAQNINIGPETDYLKLDFEGRDFTTNYTNIKDEKVVTIAPDEKITYELADGNYNLSTLEPGEKTTDLVGPKGNPQPSDDKPQPSDDKPQPSDDKPQPSDDNPQPSDDNPSPALRKPTNDDNVKVMRNWTPENITASQPTTPVAFAADLDEDELAGPVRKNVDGSVTVVRALTPIQ